MMNADLLRRIRNNLPMRVTIAALGPDGPPSKMSDQLDLPQSDLLVVFGGLVLGRAGHRPAGECRLGPGQELLLLPVDRGRVDAEVGRQFVDGPVFPDRHKVHLGI